MWWFRDSWEVWRRKVDGSITPIEDITANDVTYDNTVSGLSGDNVQEAIDEINSIKADSSSLSTVATSGSYDDLNDKPTLATVATTGDYDDLNNKPVLFSGDYDDLTNKPNLATVATTGDYDDLNNKPTVFSGDYNDLTNKPNLATVATTGVYDDLLNKPLLFSGDYNDLTNKPNLATVATTGDYGDLLNTPDLSHYLNDTLTILTDCNISITGLKLSFNIIDGNTANAPTITFGLLITYGYSSAFGMQIAYCNTGTYTRVYASNSWSAWQS